MRLYEKAGQPKKLMMLKGTSHYGAYADYFEEVAEAVVDWYDRYLRYDPVHVVSDEGTAAEEAATQVRAPAETPR